MQAFFMMNPTIGKDFRGGQSLPTKTFSATTTATSRKRSHCHCQNQAHQPVYASISGTHPTLAHTMLPYSKYSKQSYCRRVWGSALAAERKAVLGLNARETFTPRFATGAGCAPAEGLSFHGSTSQAGSHRNSCTYRATTHTIPSNGPERHQKLQQHRRRNGRSASHPGRGTNKYQQSCLEKTPAASTAQHALAGCPNSLEKRWHAAEEKGKSCMVQAAGRTGLESDEIAPEGSPQWMAPHLAG